VCIYLSVCVFDTYTHTHTHTHTHTIETKCEGEVGISGERDKLSAQTPSGRDVPEIICNPPNVHHYRFLI